ncbi:unnamed protein product, partial [Nesidiocoris tenuis]
YGSSSDDFDINSISSYLDDDSSSSSSSSTKLAGGSGTFSYTNYNQHSSSLALPTAAAYKSSASTNYPPLPGSTAATSTGQSFSSGQSGSSAYYSQGSSASPSSSPYGSTQYGSDSYSGSSSYGNSYKGESGSSSSFNFPPAGNDAFESTNDDLRGQSQYSSYESQYSADPAQGGSLPNYKPQPSYKPQSGYKPQPSYKRPSRPNPYKDSAGPTGPLYSPGSSPYGSPDAPFGSFDDHDPMSSAGSPFFDSRPTYNPYNPQAMASNYGGFDEPDNYANPWTHDPFMGMRGRPQYEPGTPPYFKDFMSYKGHHQDLPYSPNSPYSHSYPKPHSPYSGSRPSGYRGPGPKYSSGKGSRYPRQPRPGYTGMRGYSGGPSSHHSRYPSHHPRPSSGRPYSSSYPSHLLPIY